MEKKEKSLLREKSLLIVISGPSGVGKDSIRNEIIKVCDNVSRSVSVTTRAKGPNETEGVDYFYVTKEDFKRKLENNEVLEWDTYNNNNYGTLWSTVRNYIHDGKNVIFALTIPGALALKKAYPEDTVSVFILPPSMEELKSRLMGRGREDEAVIEQRIAIATSEMAHADEFDYKIVNGDFDTAINELRQIIIKEKNLRGECL